MTTTTIESFARESRSYEAELIRRAAGPRERFLEYAADLHLLCTWSTAPVDSPTPEFLTLRLSPSAGSPTEPDGGRFLLPVRKRPQQNPFTLMITIGRAENNDIVLPHRAVSKFHGFLRRVGATWVLNDAGSANGTRVDGRTLPRDHAIPVRCGTVILLGEAVVLEVCSTERVYDLLSTLP